MKRWKYLNGCEKDFDGGHAEATHKYLHKECGHPVWTAKPEIINGVLFDLVALREPITDEDDLNECIGAPEADNKYLHEIKPGVFVDVYDVLMAWSVTNPALQHLIKRHCSPVSADTNHASRIYRTSLIAQFAQKNWRASNADTERT